MDLYLLSYLIQQGRYEVPCELVADAILRRFRDGLDDLVVSPRALESELEGSADPPLLQPSARS